ncbi:MAG: histone [Nanoarchaeota archaeon]
MPARTSILPKAAVATLFLDAGAPRVSKDAVDALVDELEKRALVIADKAWKVAQHAGRRTVTGDDIKLAR